LYQKKINLNILNNYIIHIYKSDHALETLQSLARLHKPNYEVGDMNGQIKTENLKGTLKTSPFCFETPEKKKGIKRLGS